MELFVMTFGDISTNCYVAFDETTKEGVVIDVADNMPNEFLDEIKSQEVDVKYILLTHGHFDHTLGVNKLKKNFPNAKVCISKEEYTYISENAPHPFVPKEDFATPDILFEDNDEFSFGSEVLKVMLTPGHTGGGCVFYNNSCMFTGDTLFSGSVGRTDFFTGSFVDITRSVKRILSVDGNRKILPGHGNFSTQDFERKNNPYYKK